MRLNRAIPSVHALFCATLRCVPSAPMQKQQEDGHVRLNRAIPPLPPTFCAARSPPFHRPQKQQEDGHVRLKRVILIGDHHQLPPVVQNMAIQKYSRLDQPLFTRFIRLGTPFVQLNMQVRRGGEW